MPKIPIGLEAAKAKDSDILAKLGQVQKAAQSHKQHTKISQQRLEWVEQARKLAADAHRLQDDLADVACRFAGPEDGAADEKTGQEPIADAWFQVGGVRQLVSQLKQRDPERLRRVPEQAISLQGVLSSVTVAIDSLGRSFAEQAAELERECASARSSLRPHLAESSSCAEQRHADDRCNLSEEEDVLLERADGKLENYELELHRLNDQVRGELAQLDQDLAQMRRKCAAWDDEAHFRFLCIKRQFQGRGRDLFMDRLCLEFPHLSRDQLQSHEAHCDSMKYTAQRQAAAFRQWRRARLTLLRQCQEQLEERQRADGAQAARRQDMLSQKEKQRQLQGRLAAERARFQSKMDDRSRAEEDEQRRRRAAELGREQQQRRRAHSVKELCREHGERRQEQQLRQQEELAEQEQSLAPERARRAERNAARVRLRQQMDLLKQQELSQQRVAAEQERREREQRLEQAMEKLKVEAPRDPERLLTVPKRAQAEAYVEPLVCVTRGPHAGFDEQRLMGDARYKLAAALQAAGLFGTKAGHEVLSRAPAPRPAVPHEVSQIFNNGYPS